MAIIVGVDGTGDQTTYAPDFANSFVKRICTKLNSGFNVQYNKGPNMIGYGLDAAVDNGFDFIMQRAQVAEKTKAPILLTGYSRGGTAVIEIAKKLQEKDIAVNGLMLFDCVDRQANMDSSRIPDNVMYVCHVVRDPISNSRMSFDNAGMIYHGEKLTPTDKYTETTRAIYKKFICTHGGMGGTNWLPEKGRGWNSFVDEDWQENTYSFFAVNTLYTKNLTNITYRQDENGSRQVWSWVQPFLKYRGFIK